MGSDGLLRIVEAQPKSGSSGHELIWHTIDPTSGELIHLRRLHEWTQKLCLSGSLYHAVVHRVMGMVDDSTVAIMNADTLAEICRLDLTLGKADPPEPELTSREWTWSPKGNMVAVQVCSICNNSLGLIMGSSEVHIYDTASGRRIQSMLVQGHYLQMAWSKSLDKLAVCCKMETVEGNPSLLEDEEEEDTFATTIRIMDPALQTESLLPADLARESGSGWERCAWTPCGRLLIAQFKLALTLEEQTVQFLDTDGPSGVWIVDPCTLKPIFSTFESLWHVTWGWLGPSNRREEVIEAYFPGLASHVTFSHVHGTWQAVEKECDADKACTGYLTPNGRSLLYFGYLAEDCGTLYQHEFGSGEVFAVASKLISGAATVRGMLEPFFNWDVTAGFGDLENAWIPLPSSWSGLFAFIGVHSSSPSSDSLMLVDAKEHSLLGSWSGADLARQAQGRLLRGESIIDKMLTIRWSRNGRHGAVLCKGVVLIIMF